MSAPITNPPNVPPQQQQQQQQSMETNSREEIEIQLKKKLQEDPNDFNKWSEFVDFYEKGDDKDKLREAYESYLSEYPLLYLYWKKYAEMEDSLGREDAAKKVFERGVNAVSPCVELWTTYCVYVAEKSPNLTEIRSLFERAIDTIGEDFNAHSLWDKYIEFESSQEEQTNVTALYTRTLSIPMREIENFWERYKQHVQNLAISEILQQGEVEYLNQHLQSMQLDPSEDEKKKIVMSWREQTYNNTLKEVEKRKTFETVLKRTYFHIVALDQTQLSTWNQYLDFEEKEANPRRVVKLYEKCLVPCALYIEFWRKYANYYEKHGHIDHARTILLRAANVHIKRKPIALVTLAEFEEQNGNANQAENIFKNVISQQGKNHLETILRFICFYKRQNNINAALSLFQECRKGLSGEELAFFDIQHASFVRKSVGAIEKARMLYKQAIETSPSSKFAWMSFIEFEIQQQLKNEATNNNEEIIDLFEKARSQKELSDDDKIQIMKRYQDYALHFCSIQKYREVELAIQLMNLSAKTTNTAKRKADGGLDERTAKSQRTPGYSTAGQAWYQNYYNQPYNYQQYAQYYSQQQSQQSNGTQGSTTAAGTTPPPPTQQTSTPPPPQWSQ